MAAQLDLVQPAAPAPSGSAVFSADERYRYSLEWPIAEPGERDRIILMCGLNPSYANAVKLDPTLTRFRAFGVREYCSRMLVVNLFALVSTDPRGLMDADDPVGPENDRAILEAAARADLVVCAWGAHPMAAHRSAYVLDLLAGHDLWCFGTNANGSPKHPLYLGHATPLVLFRRAR